MFHVSSRGFTGWRRSYICLTMVKPWFGTGTSDRTILLHMTDRFAGWRVGLCVLNHGSTWIHWKRVTRIKVIKGSDIVL